MNPQQNPSDSDVADGSWSVYIARCADGSLYTGITKDVAARIRTHNAGKGAKYTRSRGPVVLVHTENGYSRGDALKREHAIKQMSPQRKAVLTSR